MTESVLTLLMLGGAKRVSVARMFRQAARERGYGLRLLSYELSHREPIAAEAEVIAGLRWNDPSLLDDLRRIIAENSVDGVIPFVDGAIAPAAMLAISDQSLYAPCGTPGISETLYDKIRSAELFARHGLTIPETVKWDVSSLPAIAKPRFGSASAGIRVLRTPDDINAIPQTGRDAYLLQRYVANAIEFTVDCFVDRQGRTLAVSPRQRLATIGGEVTRTRTVDDTALTLASRRVLDALAPDLRGAVTLQFLRPAANPEAEPLLMEINPRLGGGVVCSVHAGADIPGMIIDELCGRMPQSADNVQPFVEIARYQQETVFFPDDPA